MKFYFKYYFIRTRTIIPGILIEKVYAVDMFPDPVGSDRVTQSWDGQLHGWSYAVTIPQNEEVVIAVTGGAAPSYAFPEGVTVTFSGANASVGLGVGIEPKPPTATLAIRAGTWLPRWLPKYEVRVESSDGTFVVTRCNWVRP
mgnify:CR=1 FL=1